MLGNIDYHVAIQLMVIVLISIDLHELAHGLTAHWLGDPTPQRAGQLSLNPFVHMDQIGVLLLVVSSLLGYGLTWGRTFVTPNNLKFGPQRGGAIVAVAGPLTNLGIAAVIAVVLRVIQAKGCAIDLNTLNFLGLAFYVNVMLFVFNLIPLPPLDGFSILSGFLTARQLYSLAPVRQYGPMVLLLLIVGLNFTSSSDGTNPLISLIFRFGSVLVPGFPAIC